MTTLTGITHVAITVNDLKRSIAFYTNHFGFKPYHTSDKDWAMLYLGNTTLSLVVHSETKADSPEGIHPAHFGITVDSPENVTKWHTALTKKNITCSAPKLHRDKSFGFYLKDSEGNNLEVIYIPPPENPL